MRDLVRTATEQRIIRICESDFPIRRALDLDRAALAVITGVEGPSYRPMGATMVIGADGHAFGNLSSGCLDADVIQRAGGAIAGGQAETLRYGRNSPFFDIVLPCGGGLDITILPRPPIEALADAASRLAARQIVRIDLTPGLSLEIRPQVRFIVFGKGPETSCFARLARQAGYPVDLLSPDPETLDAAGFGKIDALTAWPEGLSADARSAVAVFFHDHDREPPLLEAALHGPAFYVGAQGSLRAHEARCAVLAARGAPTHRLASPFGLIPSTRDARTLAVSVLAHVLEVDAQRP
ncbi:XdhC family protein [Falsirhodobacter xinxiangensis]|uniref:XdhC family protein n=1 Tax=Falsirhodobacter xinxiangensis TaxID=2530049 RepID=UPI0010AA92B7|nr:XdhC family protein [Rhodobacter xinxiangensis]